MSRARAKGRRSAKALPDDPPQPDYASERVKFIAAIREIGERLSILEHGRAATYGGEKVAEAPNTASLRQSVGVNKNPMVIDRLVDHLERLCELRNQMEAFLNRMGWEEPPSPMTAGATPESRYPDDLLNRLDTVASRVVEHFSRIASKF